MITRAEAELIGQLFLRALNAVADIPRATIAADLRLRAGRRLRAGAGVRLPHRLREGPARPARDPARHHPGRRRHAAPGPPGRPGRAKDLIFTGRQVRADEALAMGLVDEVVPPEAVLDRALDQGGRAGRRRHGRPGPGQAGHRPRPRHHPRRRARPRAAALRRGVRHRGRRHRRAVVPRARAGQGQVHRGDEPPMSDFLPILPPLPPPTGGWTAGRALRHATAADAADALAEGPGHRRSSSCFVIIALVDVVARGVRTFNRAELIDDLARRRRIRRASARRHDADDQRRRPSRGSTSLLALAARRRLHHLAVPPRQERARRSAPAAGSAPAGPSAAGSSRSPTSSCPACRCSRAARRPTSRPVAAGRRPRARASSSLGDRVRRSARSCSRRERRPGEPDDEGNLVFDRRGLETPPSDAGRPTCRPRGAALVRTVADASPCAHRSP